MKDFRSNSDYYYVDDFNSLEKYDAHMHLNTYDESFVKQSQEDNFRLITINVDVAADFATTDEPSDQHALAERLDEGLEIIGALLAGRRVHHPGNISRSMACGSWPPPTTASVYRSGLVATS